MKEYLPTKECVDCTGQCCKEMPAPYIPKDVMRIFGSIEKAIQSGIVSIDWWEADEPLYFMRPRIKGIYKLYDPSWGGMCIHLTVKGCRLTREEMPFFCKTLEPKENKDSHCDDHIKKENSKYLAGLLWKRSKIDLERWR